MIQNYDFLNSLEEKRLDNNFTKIVSFSIRKIKQLVFSRTKISKKSNLIYEKSFEYDKLELEEILKNILQLKTILRYKKISDNDFFLLVSFLVAYTNKTIGKRPYAVQIEAALHIYYGKVVQMATGEGKTLVAMLASILLSFKGKKVHIVTSNDYLAQRDAIHSSELLNPLNLSVGCVLSSLNDKEKFVEYDKHIVYSTSKQILGDFLRDRIQNKDINSFNSYLIDSLQTKNYQKRFLIDKLDAIIIDEADSILADDAVTPLIISKKVPNEILKESVLFAKKIIENLEEDIHYRVHERFLDVVFTQKGYEYINQIVFENKLLSSNARKEYLLKQALVAQKLYILNKHYIIKDEKIVIVDSRSGRIMSDRTWSNGLHQAIEAKENLPITYPTVAIIKMSFQRFFRLYNHLCGMSGTLQKLDLEFHHIYNVSIVKIPHRVPSKMKILKDKIFLNNEAKIAAMIEYIKDKNKDGIPLLVGFTNIDETDMLSNHLKKEGIEHTLLNALYEEEESAIIGQAGKKDCVTISTNMAGRGTDIHIDNEVNQLGGLHVITSQRDRSRRIDLQYFGRCARQGQNGVAISFLSLEDPIMNAHLPLFLRKIFIKYFNLSITKFFIKYCYIYFQYKIEKDISKYRNQLLNDDFIKEDSMSFV